MHGNTALFLLVFPGWLSPNNRNAGGMDLRHTVATNLRRMRRERGLSQEALAWDAGINRSHMAVIETGKSWVRLDIIAKLAAALEVEPHELLVAPAKRGRR
jgi:DNA-binding Xre family transcriptional regulator